MALRAGYYGLKKKFIDKVNKWDQLVFPRSEQAVLGAKNLAENTLVSQTKNDVVVTVNANKTVNLNGTASTWTTLEIMRDLSGLVDFGDLILNGGFSDDGGSTSFLGIQKISAGSSLKYNGSGVIDKGNGVIFNLSGNLELMNGSSVTASELSVVLYINSGATMTNKLYKPMIRLATDPDPTYAPPAMTNRELTVSAADQKTAINAIITAATSAADFAAFKTAMGAITPVTRSLNRTASPEDVPEEVIEEEKTVTKKTTRKTTVKEGE